MTRDIKFRAWDKNEKVMYQKFPALDDYGSIQGIIETQTHLVPLQFTGLLDKNGKEIYEADRVKCVNKYDEEFTLEVRWIPHLAGFYYVDDTCKKGEWISQLGMFDNGEEVIGNVYENPELVKTV